MFRECDVVVDIARAAGALVKNRFGNSNHVQTKEDQTLVSEADLISHEYIAQSLARIFPNDLQLSEESPDALHKQITNSRTWVIDPLDGTSNFLAHIPIFAVAIALVENNETLLGVIYDPLHDEMFVCAKGQGATLNGTSIHVSTKDAARGSMLFAGRGYKEKDQQRHAQIISALERQTTYFRRLGSATIMLAYVASGRADAVILTGNNPWDTVVGSLLVCEAGGKISDYCGNLWSHQSRDLVATNGLIHQKLIGITNSLEGGPGLCC
ncbi:inositol monophosphatase [Candidatus Uhrbacteria bacterium]|nr:inositol monophosphatase [Candidatus Uhrbacteria bacterium]